MTLAWLEVAAMLLMLFTGTQRTVAAHKERQGGRGQGAWWTSILMPSLACVLLPWAPAEVQTEQPDPSGRAPLSSYQHIRSGPNCHETSQKMSGDVLKTSSDALWCSEELPRCEGEVCEFAEKMWTSQKVKFRASEEEEKEVEAVDWISHFTHAVQLRDTFNASIGETSLEVLSFCRLGATPKKFNKQRF